MVSSFHNGAKLTFLKHDTVHIKKIFSVRYSTKHSQSLLNLGLNRKLKKKTIRIIRPWCVLLGVKYNLIDRLNQPTLKAGQKI